MYLYQQNRRYFAQIAEGLKDLGMAELEALGAAQIKPGFRGFHFTADQAALYRINYCSRLVTRILAPLVRFDCRSPEALYERAKKVPWTDWLTLQKTFAVFASVSNSKIAHSRYAALRLKDAVVDQFRERSGQRPDVDPREPDIWFNLRIDNDRAVISLDTSGGSLHRRGYRRQGVAAPMRETLAAAMVRLSGWDGQMPLYDPMCGSGTLLLEALMHHCRLPAALLRRRFGFEALPDYDPGIQRTVWAEINGRVRDLPRGLVIGSDRAKGAVSAAKTNCRAFPQGQAVTLFKGPFQNLAKLAPGVIVTNPPYGRRLDAGRDLSLLYKELGDFLKQKCRGSKAYIYFGEREMIKRIGLKASWKKPLRNGGLDGRLVKFELY